MTPKPCDERVDVLALRAVEHVDQQPRPLQVRQEVVAEADALRRALQQARHVDHRQLPAVVAVDRAEHRLDGGERVVSDLRRGVGDAAQQAGLPDVGEAEQRSVSYQFQLELESPHLAVDPDLGDARRLAGRRGEAPVAAATRPAAGDDGPRRRVREVGDQRAVGRQHLRADGHDHEGVLAAAARAVGALAVAAVACADVRLVAQRDEVAALAVGDQHDVAAAAAIAAEGPPRGTYFSRRNAIEPSPPRPPSTYTVTRSENTGGPPLARRAALSRRGLRGQNGDDALAAALAELDGAGDGGEDRVVAAAPRALPGVEPRPRWRQMIEPACTCWPANTFTPRRLAWESRPLREEPSPFLCAIEAVSLLELDPLDLDQAQARPVADLALGVLLRAVGHDVDLLAERVRDDAGRDGDALEVVPEARLVAVRRHQHGRRERVALRVRQAVDAQLLARANPVLLAPEGDDGVHGRRFRGSHGTEMRPG